MSREEGGKGGQIGGGGKEGSLKRGGYISSKCKVAIG